MNKKDKIVFSLQLRTQFVMLQKIKQKEKYLNFNVQVPTFGKKKMQLIFPFRFQYFKITHTLHKDIHKIKVQFYIKFKW